MRTNHPMRGLLQFYFYAQSGNIAALAVLCLGLAVVAIISGNIFVYNSFFMLAIAGTPYVIIIAMGGKQYPKWERFRLTMPIKRGDLAGAQYLSILLASLAGLPLAVLVAVLTFSIHEIDYSLATALINILAVLATPLVFAGLIFPVGNTKFGENKQETTVMLCLAVTVGFNLFLMPRMGAWLGLPDGLTSLATFAIGLAVFITSCLITRRIYAKRDF